MSQPAEFKRIVIIDDDPDMLHLMKQMLQPAYEVLGTQDPTQALALVEQAQPDLILLDLMMPDVDGWMLYNALREHEASKHIPVIIVTAKSNAMDKVLGLRIAQVDGYLNKPFSRSELLRSIRKILGGTDEADNTPAAS